MANFQLVWLPLIVAMLLFTLAALYLAGINRRLNRSDNKAGIWEARLLGQGLIILGGFAFFIFLFFVVTQ